MKTLLFRFAYGAWRLFMLSLLSFCLFLVSSFALFVHLESFRPDLESLAVFLLERPVQIGRIDSYWDGFQPVLVLNRVRLGEAVDFRRHAHFDRVTVSLDLTASVLNKQVITNQIDISGTYISLLRDKYGTIHISGLFSESGITGGADGLPGNSALWLLKQPHLSVSAEQLVWHDVRAGTHVFSGARLDLEKQADHHNLYARLRLPRNHYDLAGQDLSVQGGGIFLAARSYWTLDGLVRIGGRIQAQNIRLNSAHGRLHLKNTSGQFEFNYLEDGWAMQFRELKIRTARRNWAENRLSLELHRYADYTGIHGELEFMPLEELLPLLDGFPGLSPNWREALQTMNPRAELHQLRFDYDNAGLHFNTRFRHWRNHAWENVPALRSVDGEIDFDGNEIKLGLNSQHAAMEFPGLFQQTFSIHNLQGNIHWRKAAGGWLTYTSGLHWRDDNIKQAGISGALYIDPDYRVYSDLRMSIKQAKPEAVYRYIPDAGAYADELGDTRAWLKSAFRGGSIHQAEAVLQGEVNTALFLGDNGLAQVRIHVGNTSLDYAPGWPALEKVQAEVLIRGRHLQINAHQAGVMGNRISRVQALIPDLSAAEAVLSVTGEAQGSTPDALRFVSQSPIRQEIELNPEELDMQGNVSVDLELTIPLKAGTNNKVSGNIHLKGNRLLHKPLDITLQDLHGTLVFSNSIMQGKGFKARLFDAPVQMDLYTKADDPLVRANFKGNADAVFIDKLGRHFSPAIHWPELTAMLPGTTEWQAEILFPVGQAKQGQLPAKLKIYSDLRGLAVQWPEPFSKKTPEQRDFSLLMDFFPEQPPHAIRLKYADKLRVRLHRDETQAWRGYVHVGKAAAQVPAVMPEGIHVRGNLNHLPLSVWRQPAFAINSDAKVEKPAVKLDLDVGQLEAGGHYFHSAQLKAESLNGYWGGTLNSQEATGLVQYNPKQRRLSADFERLVLKILETGQTGPDSSQFFPQQLPALSLSCEELIINGTSLGRLRLDTQPLPDGLELKKLLLDSKSTHLLAQGNLKKWQNILYAQLDLTLKTADFGQSLKGLGFSGSGLYGGNGILKSRLFWSDQGGSFDWHNISGHLELDMAKGALAKVEPGMGRLFGLFDLLTMPHLLLADSGDIFQEGLPFSRLHGIFNLANGYAYTDNLQIESPVAQIDISGRTDFVNQLYDQTVAVTPHASSAMPVAGALMGGPQLGVLMLMMQKALQPEIEQAITARYAVTGNWKEPKITRLTE